MYGVLNGFVLLLSIIGVGYLAARIGIVKGDQRKVLNNVSFYVAGPPLLFTMVAASDISIILSPVILVIAAAAASVAIIYVLLSRLWFKRDIVTTTTGAASTSYVNSTNLGLPIALYILGDAAYVAPLLLVQQLIYSPIILSVLEANRGDGSAGLRSAIRSVFRAITNPIIAATVLGLIFAVFEIPIPELVLNPMMMLGAAAVPMILLSFGMSLKGERMLQKGGDFTAVFVVSALKMIVMPLLAWAFAVAIGLAPYEVFAATIFAALPTAQYVYNFSVVYGKGEILARDTVLLTTLLSLPVITVIAWLLAT